MRTHFYQKIRKLLISWKWMLNAQKHPQHGLRNQQKLCKFWLWHEKSLFPAFQAGISHAWQNDWRPLYVNRFHFVWYFLQANLKWLEFFIADTILLDNFVNPDQSLKLTYMSGGGGGGGGRVGGEGGDTSCTYQQTLFSASICHQMPHFLQLYTQ